MIYRNIKNIEYYQERVKEANEALSRELRRFISDYVNELRSYAYGPLHLVLVPHKEEYDNCVVYMHSSKGFDTCTLNELNNDTLYNIAVDLSQNSSLEFYKSEEQEAA